MLSSSAATRARDGSAASRVFLLGGFCALFLFFLVGVLGSGSDSAAAGGVGGAGGSLPASDGDGDVGVYVDMHIHTTESDGDRTVEEQLRIAQAQGMPSLWITDHDMIRSIAGVGRIQALATDVGISVGFGVEVTVLWDRKEHHLLGYFPDHVWQGQALSAPMTVLQDACAIVKDSRKNRNDNLIARVNTLLGSDEGNVYFESGSNAAFSPLDIPTVSAWARENADLFDASSLGRPHFSKYLISIEGLRADLIFGPRSGDGFGVVTADGSVFWDAEAAGKEGVHLEGLLHSGALERRKIVFKPLPILDAIEMINAADGKAVVAHITTLGSDWHARFEPQLAALKEGGLWGIEGYSSEISEENHELIHAMALKNGLQETGGSDNHGTLKPYAKLGKVYRAMNQDDPPYFKVDTWRHGSAVLSKALRSP
jgi:predicted metal-dependent phosphoesterase TrpH